MKVAFSDAAANTVSVPLGASGDAAALEGDAPAEADAGELAGEADELGADVLAADDAALVVVDVMLPFEPQPTTKVATSTPVTAETVLRARLLARERVTG